MFQIICPAEFKIFIQGDWFKHTSCAPPGLVPALNSGVLLKYVKKLPSA